MNSSDESRPPEFWAPRRSFLPLIPEIELATDLIDAAADAYLEMNWEEAEKLIREADFEALRVYAPKIMGATDPEIHRVRDVQNAPLVTQRHDRPARSGLSESIQHSIFKRDGWRCRFCGIRIVSKCAVSVLEMDMKDAVRWTGLKKIDQHGALRVLVGQVDHLLPLSRGGTHDAANLVAACAPCNIGRSKWTLEEVGFFDPRDTAPVLDNWDGLRRLCR